MTGRHQAIRGKAVELMAVSGLHREEPVAARGRTHGEHHQADIQLEQRGRLERQRHGMQLTSDSGRAGKLIQ